MSLGVTSLLDPSVLETLEHWIEHLIGVPRWLLVL